MAGVPFGGLAGGHDPGSAVAGEPEDGKPGEVDRGGQEREVCGDPGVAADAGAAAAVAAAHQVADLPLDLRPGGPVVGLPGRVGLAGAGGGQAGLVPADGDGAAVPGPPALAGPPASPSPRPQPSCPGQALASP